MVIIGREGHLLSAHGSDESVGGGPTEFYGLDQVSGGASYSIYPLERGAVAYSLAADPVTGLKAVRESYWVPGDAGDDDVLTCSVNDVGIHPEYWEPLPFPVLQVPQNLNSGVVGLGDGLPLAESDHP